MKIQDDNWYINMQKLILGRTGEQFLRYYILFFICLVLLIIPFYYINSSMMSQNYIDTASAFLKTGLSNFENDLSFIETTSFTAFNTPRFRRFSYVGMNYQLHDYYFTVNLPDDFKRYFAAANMIEDCGFKFSNDTIVTTKAIHFSGTDFYNHYFIHGKNSEYQQWITELTDNLKYSAMSAYLLPLTAFYSYGTNYNAITYVQHFINQGERTSFFFATLKSDYILSRLATDEVLREGRVVIYDPMGNILFGSNGYLESVENIITIDITGERRGIRVTLDIPQRIFNDKMKLFRNIVLVFTLVYIIAGVVLSIFFARRSARPVHTLIEKLKQEEELQRDNMFARLLYSPMCSIKTQESVKKYFPDFPVKFCLAAIDLIEEETTLLAQTVQQAMIRELIESGISGGSYIHFSGSTLVLLLPDNGQEAVFLYLRKLACELQQKFNIIAKIALSETVNNIQVIYKAFSLVRHLLRLPHNFTDNKILQKEDIEPFSFSIDFVNTTRFYELLLHGEEDQAVTFIENILDELSKREYTEENDIQQVFFLYRRILIQVVIDLKLGIEKDVIMPDYDPSEEINNLFAKIINSIKRICAELRKLHDAKDIVFEQSIVKFVDDNITNPGLYTRMVTNNLKINDTRLQSIFRRRTGKSYLEYVEYKRMVLAKDLLQKTQRPISQITRDCGYSTENAFYKAFKRHYGIAPSELRN